MLIYEIHNRLLHQRADLADRLDRLRVDLTRDGSAGRTTTELALEQQDDEVLDRMATSTVADLNHVNAALARIAAGTFGICERCGEVIEEQRLSALPFTTYCIKCAQISPPQSPP